MKRAIENCKPAVQRHWLVLAAGLLWLGAGTGLMVAACLWLEHSPWPLSLVLAASGVAIGAAVYVFGFSRLVGKNLARICAQPEKVCLFAFQGWRSYFLILLMMLLGYTIRHLPIPRQIDALIYFAMGSALAFASSLYFSHFSGGGCGGN